MTLPNDVQNELVARYLASEVVGEPKYHPDENRDTNPQMDRKRALELCRYLITNDPGNRGSSQRRTYYTRQRRFEGASGKSIEKSISDAKDVVNDYPDELLRLVW